MEESIKRLDFLELKDNVRDLVIVQKRTDEMRNQLAETKRKTEEELSKLIGKHRKTREQIGSLSHGVAYVLEDRAYAVYPLFYRKTMAVSS